MTTLATARFEMESIDIIDKGCLSDEGVFGFPTVVAQVAPGELPRDGRKETEPRDVIVPDLAGISETMLWSLHNRASEARRPDGVPDTLDRPGRRMAVLIVFVMGMVALIYRYGPGRSEPKWKMASLVEKGGPAKVRGDTPNQQDILRLDPGGARFR